MIPGRGGRCDALVLECVAPGKLVMKARLLFSGTICSEYSVSWASGVRRHLGTQVGALWAAECGDDDDG
jgi:hypothetical protein